MNDNLLLKLGVTNILKSKDSFYFYSTQVIRLLKKVG